MHLILGNAFSLYPTVGVLTAVALLNTSKSKHSAELRQTCSVSSCKIQNAKHRQHELASVNFPIPRATGWGERIEMNEAKAISKSTGQINIKDCKCFPGPFQLSHVWSRMSLWGTHGRTKTPLPMASRKQKKNRKHSHGYNMPLRDAPEWPEPCRPNHALLTSTNRSVKM